MFKKFRYLSLIFSSFVILAIPAVQADILPVYKFVMSENSIIASKCTDEDQERVSSKMALLAENEGHGKTQFTLRIKACTHKYGLKKFKFSFVLPELIFNTQWLLAIPVGQGKSSGSVYVQRLADKGEAAVFSLNPDSFGSKAEGVQSIKISIPNTASASESLLTLTQGVPMWNALQITYKGGFLMPTVVLNGSLQLVEFEEVSE